MTFTYYAIIVHLCAFLYAMYSTFVCIFICKHLTMFANSIKINIDKFWINPDSHEYNYYLCNYVYITKPIT